LQTQPIEVDLEGLLRKARKERKEAKAAGTGRVQESRGEHYTQNQAGDLAQKIEAALAGVPNRVDDIDPANEVSEGEEDHIISQDIDPEPVFERQQEYQEPDAPSTFVQPLPSIEAALEAAFEGQQEQSEFDSLSSRDLRGEETLNVHGSTDSEIVPWFGDPPDAEDVFLQRSGYIVPLNNEALAAIQVVLGKEAAIKMAGIKSDSRDFRKTLTEDRNVFSEETRWTDPEWAHLDTYHSSREADEASIADFLDRLWLADLGFCRDQQEAIFQRTVMMAMINRHQLIFAGNKRPIELPESALMFGVEATWSCPPMPTRRYEKKADKNKEEPKTFATMPKPDLCVSFRTRKIVDSAHWKLLLPRTQQLICYEGIEDDNNEAGRAFGFFFVEAKRSRTEPDDKMALYQALNDASQALHNMYEFFREAKQTPEFFKRVRVFSATASEKGVIIRVHWARELPEDTELSTDRIVPEYPLQFQYQTYESFKGKEFDRLKVVEVFERIMVGYGERQLLELLKTAAASVKKKASDAWRKRDQVPLPRAFNTYRYGQSGKPGSRTASRPQTPAGEGNQPTNSMFMPPPNVPRSMQESYTSDTTEVIDQTVGESTSLSQGVAELQTDSFDSQRSNGSQKRRRGTMPTKQRDHLSKKRRTKE
jgi:hypothetical protein